MKTSTKVNNEVWKKGKNPSMTVSSKFLAHLYQPLKPLEAFNFFICIKLS